jgi:hypothetical protein
MSEITLLSKNLPAHLKALELDATTKALMGGSGGGDSKRISIEGGVWRMLVNGKEAAKNEDRTMNVVIVAAAPETSRTFYAGAYKKGVVASPDCWSADSKIPDAKAKNPQATKCADCPQNIKGSGQGDSRACRFSQRLAVVLENDIAGDVYQLTLPATSIWGEGTNGKWPLKTYAKMVGSKGIPISSVVTEMRFDTDSATPKLTFKAVRYLETEEFNEALEQGKTDASTRAITMTVAQVDGVKEVAVVEEEFEEAAEPAVETQPVKRTSKKEEAPAPKKDVSKILEEWDNE